MLVDPPRSAKKLRLIARETVGDHRVFTVERLTFEGAPRDLFVFGCPDWCNVLAETIIEGRPHLLFLWQYRPGTDAMSLEIPGGVIDPGEAPEAAAIRELREETGYEAESVELLGVVDANPALQPNRCHTFLARGCRLAGAPSPDDMEDLEIRVVDAADVPAILDAGEVTHALVIVALERYLRRSRTTSGEARLVR